MLPHNNKLNNWFVNATKRKHKEKPTNRWALMMKGTLGMKDSSSKLILTQLDSHFSPFPQGPKLVQNQYNIFFVLYKHYDPVFFSDQHKYKRWVGGTIKNFLFIIPKEIFSFKRNVEKLYQYLEVEKCLTHILKQLRWRRNERIVGEKNAAHFQPMQHHGEWYRITDLISRGLSNHFPINV